MKTCSFSHLPQPGIPVQDLSLFFDLYHSNNDPDRMFFFPLFAINEGSKTRMISEEQFFKTTCLLIWKKSISVQIHFLSSVRYNS